MHELSGSIIWMLQGEKAPRRLCAEEAKLSEPWLAPAPQLAAAHRGAAFEIVLWEDCRHTARAEPFL